MFETISHFAEQAAASASRRAFLGRLCNKALAAATAVGGLLALGQNSAFAARCPDGQVKLTCRGRSRKSKTICCPPGYHCQQYRLGWICCPDGWYCR
jgi:hypothetical protein